MRRRVVVTGVGAVTPIGITGRVLWDGVRAERSAVRSLTRFDPSIFRSHNAAEVNDFIPTDHLESKRAKRLDQWLEVGQLRLKCLGISRPVNG